MYVYFESLRNSFIEFIFPNYRNVSKFSIYWVCICDKTFRLIHDYLFSLFTGGGNSQYNSLYPGNSSNITLLLSNYGDDSTFQIHISHDNISSVFYYNSSQTVLTVKENKTAEIIITVTASKNATDGDRISFIVTASTFTTTNQRSDFVTFLFVVSTLPPPTQIENVSEGQLLQTFITGLYQIILSLQNQLIF